MMFGIDFCDVEMKSSVLSRVFSWRHPHYMQLHQKLPNYKQEISEKDVVYFQPEENHETIAESEKV